METNYTNIYQQARISTHDKKSKPLTQMKAAELLGLSRDAVAKWETGECAPTEKNVAKMARLYGPSIAYQHLLEQSALGPYLPEIKEMNLQEVALRLVDANEKWANQLTRIVHICMDNKIDEIEKKDFEESKKFFRDLAGLCLSLSISGLGGK